MLKLFFKQQLCRLDREKSGESLTPLLDMTSSHDSTGSADADEFQLSNIRDAQHLAASNQKSGPWTHSTNSYSRKLNYSVNGTEPTFSTKKSTSFAIVGICSVVFVVGLALGIVIGHFVINKEISDNSDGSMFSDNLKEKTGPCFCNDTDIFNQPNKTLPSSTPPPSTSAKPKSPGECKQCTIRNPFHTTGSETDTSPFAPLTAEEIGKVVNSLQNKQLVSSSNDMLADRLAYINLFQLKKSKVLNYLDNNGPFPGRYVIAHVIRGSRNPPDVMEYKIGPLNETYDKMDIKPLRQDGEISFNQRPFDTTEASIIRGIVRPHMQAIHTLLSESFDGVSYQNMEVGTVSASLPSANPDDRISTVFLHYNEPGAVTLRLLPVTCRVHHAGQETSKWYASDFYYLSQGPFNSGNELQVAYDSGLLQKIKLPDGFWTKHSGEFDLKFNTSLPQRHLSDIPPPRTYEPEGPRYTVKGHRVQWMDWEFEFSTSSIHGPAIFDVRFKGDRIAYEISLQDITLIYSSQTNGAGPPALSDTVYQLGSYHPPRYGLDCPDRGSILLASRIFFSSIKTERAACIFEADGQQALWRHNSQGLTDHYLVIRAAMNLGNYDYTAEWRFHLDGSLETGLAASGYLYSAFWDPNDQLLNSDKSYTPFGYRISDFMIGPIHDHSFVFKVDLDILGTENSFETVHWRAGTALEAFQSETNVTEKPEFFYFNHTRYLQHELLENEKGFTNDPLNPKYFTVVNEQQRNFWGVRRGYRILPHSTVAENLPDHLMFTPWEHLRHQISVTKRKDWERHGTESVYTLQQPTVSGRGLSTSLNNETVRNTDLVIWVTEKFMHAPTSEDLPMTVAVHNGFTLKPYNYFDRTQVFDVQSHYSQFVDPYVTKPCYENLPSST